jgi:hypothetical protein
LWALGNIAGDSAACRDAVLASGGMEPLLRLTVPTAPISLLRNATWTLSNLCRGKPKPALELVQAAIPLLAQLLYSNDEEIVTDASWALSYITGEFVFVVFLCFRCVFVCVNCSTLTTRRSSRTRRGRCRTSWCVN